MRGRTAAIVFSLTVLGFAAVIAIHARGAWQGHAFDQPLSEQERTRLLAAGKELFMTRCARSTGTNRSRPAHH